MHLRSVMPGSSAIRTSRSVPRNFRIAGDTSGTRSTSALAITHQLRAGFGRIAEDLRPISTYLTYGRTGQMHLHLFGREWKHSGVVFTRNVKDCGYNHEHGVRLQCRLACHERRRDSADLLGHATANDARSRDGGTRNDRSYLLPPASSDLRKR